MVERLAHPAVVPNVMVLPPCQFRARPGVPQCGADSPYTVQWDRERSGQRERLHSARCDKHAKQWARAQRCRLLTVEAMLADG